MQKISSKLMETFPLVSVILPTYNRAELLPRAIESVLKQTYPNWELIIWDDGSTDNTEEIVRSYNNERIKYYFEMNRGVDYARNQSIEIAQGEYLAFLDSDDEWVEDKLSLQTEVMIAFPRIDVLFSDFLNIDVSTKETRTAFEQFSDAMEFLNLQQSRDNLFIIKGGIFESLAHSNFIALDSVITRRDAFESVKKFNGKLRNSEDFLLWWRLSLAGVCFAYLKNNLLIRYKLPESLSSSSIVTYENKIKSLNICLQESIASGRKDLVAYLNRASSNTWQKMIPLFNNDGDKKGMLRAFFQSMKYGFNLNSFRLLIDSIFRA